MTDYGTTLAARRKALCTVYDFPAQSARFVSRMHSGISTVGWDHVFVGAAPFADDGARLDVTRAGLTVGSASFGIPDRKQAVTAWLALFDGTLRLAEVTRRQGFMGGDEANYQVSRWHFDDYEVADKPGGYVFKLANVLKAMGQSLYDDFDGENYRIDEATYGAGLGSGAATITLEKSPKGIWREPGFAILYEREKKIFELVQYQTIGGTGDKDLQTCTRRKYGVGSASITHLAPATDVWQVWVKRGNPFDILLEWLTTTDTPGANGTHDTGDGDGLGVAIDQSYLNASGIELIRDTYWPQPTFVGDAKTAGTAVLFVEKEPIDDVARFIEDNLLLPFGLFPLVGADERYSVETYYRTPPPATDVMDEWRRRDFKPANWARNWDGRENNLSMLTDWHIADGRHAFQKSKVQPDSIARFGRSKPLAISGRGHRTGRLGFPDYGSLSDIDKGSTRVLLELANPGTELRVRAFYKHKDLPLGSLVRINLPVVPDVARGTRGLPASHHLITRRKIADDRGYVELEIRQRRVIKRPAFVAPNAVASTYTAASESDRQFCYLTPDDDGQFANGDPAYTVVP